VIFVVIFVEAAVLLPVRGPGVTLVTFAWSRGPGAGLDGDRDVDAPGGAGLEGG
jgi:hypothetical protein